MWIKKGDLVNFDVIDYHKSCKKFKTPRVIGAILDDIDYGLVIDRKEPKHTTQYSWGSSIISVYDLDRHRIFDIWINAPAKRQGFLRLDVTT